MKRLLNSIIFCLFMTLFFSVIAQAEDSTVVSPKINIIIDGTQTTFENPPITVQDRTLLPLRDLVKSLGLPNDNSHVVWNEADQSITIKDKSFEVKLAVNNKVAYINSKPITLDISPTVYNDKTYIPVRFVSQSFGRKVTWDEDSQSILITKEDVYSKIKKLLNDVSLQFENKDKYQYQKSISFNAENYSYSIDASYKIDKKAHKALNTYTLKSGQNKQMDGFKIDEWSQDETRYQNISTKGTWDWDLLESTDQSTMYNILSTLADNDLANTGLVIQDENDSEITLKGDVILKNIFYTKPSSGYILGDMMDSNYSAGNTVIKIDKKSNSIISASLTFNIKNKLGANAYVVDSKMIITLDKFSSNDYTELTPPEGLPQITQEMKNSYWLKIGEDYYYDDKFEDAINTLDKVLINDPKNSEAILYKGKTLLEKGETSEAIKLFDKAVEINPKLAIIYVDLGKKYLNAGNNDSALEYFDKAINAGLKNAEAYFSKGEILYNSGKYDEALDNYVEAAKVNHGYLTKLSNKIFNLRLGKKHETALKYAEKLIELDAKYISGYYEKIYALEALKRYDEALATIEDAEKIKPNDLRTLQEKFTILRKMGKEDEVNDLTNEILNTEAKTTSDYTCKGNVLLNLKRYEEAIECYNKSIELDPYDPAPYYNKGLALYNLKKYEDASSAFDEAINLNKDFVDAYLYKSFVLMRLGKTYESKIYFNKYTELKRK